MKFLKLPVKFYNTSLKELESYEDLGIPVPVDEDNLRDGFIYVNPVFIGYFNEDNEGEVNLVLKGEPGQKICMPFEKFLEIVDEFI